MVLVVAVLVSSCSSPSVRELEPRELDDLAGPREDLPGLSNFAQLSDDLYRGAQPSAEGFVHLEALGIKTVVNLRSRHANREVIKGLDLDSIEIPIDPRRMEIDHVVQFLRIATDPARQPIFVHCKHGADRTGVMVVAYRIVGQGWSRSKALSELDRFGFHRYWRNLRHLAETFDEQELWTALSNSTTTAPLRE